MKNISCHFILDPFFCTSLLGDAEMMHKLHVLQYPRLSNISPMIASSSPLFVILIHSHTHTHTHFLSVLLEG